MTHPYFVKAEQPRILAHRGLVTAEGRESGVWENTAAAFAAAHAAGAEYIETDCQITADGDVVLFHDHDLRRLVGDPRAVHEVRTRELSALFAEHGGLLTVAEALSAFPETRFNIDVKTPAAAAPLGPILAAHTHRVLVTSFSDANRRATLEAVRQTGTALRPATSGGSRTIAALRSLSGGLGVLPRALLRAAHRADTEVHVWTVNDADDMRRLIDAGVDGVVTDRADLAVATFRKP